MAPPLSPVRSPYRIEWFSLLPGPVDAFIRAGGGRQEHPKCHHASRSHSQHAREPSCHVVPPFPWVAEAPRHAPVLCSEVLHRDYTRCSRRTHWRGPLPVNSIDKATCPIWPFGTGRRGGVSHPAAAPGTRAARRAGGRGRPPDRLRGGSDASGGVGRDAFGGLIARPLGVRVLVATVPQSGERVEPGWIRRAGARPGTVSFKGRRDGEQSAFVFGSLTECPPMTGSRYGFIYRFFTLTCSALTGRLRGTRDASGLRGGTGDHRPADRPSTNQRRRPAELALGAGLPARPLTWSWRTSTARRSTRSSTRKDPLEQFTSNVTATTLAIHTTVVRVSERCAARSPRPRRRSGRRDRSIRDGAGRGHRLSRCSFPACSHEPDRALPSRTNQGLSRAHPGSEPARAGHADSRPSAHGGTG